MILMDFLVKGQKISKNSEKPYIVNRSNNYLELRFQFDLEAEPSWEDLPKYILFHVAEKNYLLPLDTVIITDDGVEVEYFTVKVPSYAMKGNRLRFTVYGEDIEEEYRITTQEYTLITKKCGWTDITDHYTDEYDTDMYLILSKEIEELNVSLEDKATHEEVTRTFAGVELEIKRAYRLLENDIRTYGGN